MVWPGLNEYVFSNISLFCIKAGELLYRSPLVEADFVSIKCHLLIRMVLRLGTDGRYYVTKGKILMRIFGYLICRADILSLKLS